MNHADAWTIAQTIKMHLEPFAYPIIIAGSLRRGCPQVRDIDLVLVPTRWGSFLCAAMAMGRMISQGDKIIRIQLPQGINLDLYVASRETLPTILLVRTGSASFNRLLATELRRHNLSLKANGTGVIDLKTGEIVARTEREIFTAAGWTYTPPWAREMPLKLSLDNEHIPDPLEVEALDLHGSAC